ncbi:MAG: transposase [Candidatus Marinimicrobia bacterium]|nr:transposase [Candidatus Neomarinimicrobiota bacterium]
MIKITQKTGNIQHLRRLVLAFDVSKDKLDCYGEYGSRTVEDSFANRTEVIEQKLFTLSGLAQSAGFEGLHILAEPTGIYHRKLLRTARRLGHTTALVNVESVSKLKVVESNDTGKTDEKDSRVILMLWKLGKTLTDRVFRGEYLLLREYNRIYDVEEKELVRVRNRIHECLMELYCDYSFKKDFLYGKSGRALMELYGCNPYRVVRSGYTRFFRRMR